MNENMNEDKVKNKSMNLLRTLSRLFSKVEGRREGKSLMARGKANSINGTMINIENGINLNKSLVVRTKSLCSRRVILFPNKQLIRSIPARTNRFSKISYKQILGHK